MRTRRTLTPNQKSAKKFLERYGKLLICIPFRYDELWLEAVWRKKAA